MDTAAITAPRDSRSILPDPPADSLMGLARHIAIGGISGLFAGVLVGGVGGRLFMRIAGAAASERAQGLGTEAGFTVGEVTVGGTVALVVFVGLFTGIVGAVLYLTFLPWVSWGGRWRGGVFGVLLFAVASATSDVMNPDNIDFFILKNSFLLVSLIALLFLAFGAVIDGAFRYLDGRMPGSAENWGGIAPVYISFTVLGVLALIPFVASFGTDSICDCEPPVLASVSVVVSAIGTAVWWASALLTDLPRWSRTVAAVFGYSGLAGAFMFGLGRAISDAIEIIQ